MKKQLMYLVCGYTDPEPVTAIIDDDNSILCYKSTDRWETYDPMDALFNREQEADTYLQAKRKAFHDNLQQIIPLLDFFEQENDNDWTEETLAKIDPRLLRLISR